MRAGEREGERDGERDGKREGERGEEVILMILGLLNQQRSEV